MISNGLSDTVAGRRFTRHRAGACGWGFGVLLVALTVWLGGCASDYMLRGRVVEGGGGAPSEVRVVSRGDEALKADDTSGAGAVVEVWIDEDTPKRQQMPTVVCDSQGFFEVPVGVMGAGFLEYDARVVVRRSSHASADGVIALPSSGKRVLVTLPRGSDRGRIGPGTDALEEAMREGRRYLEPGP